MSLKVIVSHCFNAMCIAIILCVSSALGMEKDCTQALLAEEYNRNNPLLCDDVLNSIFSYCCLENKIETLITLSYTCKRFNKLWTFESIVNLCENYAQGDKDLALQRLISPSIDDRKEYAAKRLPALILICAGADPKTRGKESENVYSERFLNTAVGYNDVQLVKMALKCSPDPNAGGDGFNSPFFLSARTVEMVQVFIDADIDIRMTTNFDRNVLYYLPSLELLDFYLKCGVDPRKKFDAFGDCLLHRLASSYGDDNDKKAQLLLGVMSDMINYLNGFHETPIDVAQKEIKKNEGWLKNPCMNHVHINKGIKNLERLIAVFRRHGGKTASELDRAK